MSELHIWNLPSEAFAAFFCISLEAVFVSLEWWLWSEQMVKLLLTGWTKYQKKLGSSHSQPQISWQPIKFILCWDERQEIRQDYKHCQPLDMTQAHPANLIMLCGSIEILLHIHAGGSDTHYHYQPLQSMIFHSAGLHWELVHVK